MKITCMDAELVQANSKKNGKPYTAIFATYATEKGAVKVATFLRPWEAAALGLGAAEPKKGGKEE